MPRCLQPKNFWKCSLWLFIAAFLMSLAQTRAATSDNWTGNSSTNFEGALNWSSGTPANDLSTHIAGFSGAPTARQPSLGVSRNIAGLSFGTAGGGWTLGSAAGMLVLTNGASGITTAGQISGTNLIRANLALGAAQTWQAGTGGFLLFTGSVWDGTNSAQNINPNLPISALTINAGSNKGMVILSPSAGNSVCMIGSNSASLINLKTGGWLALGGDGTNAPLTAGTNYIRNTSTGGDGTWGINAPGALQVNSGTWLTGDLGMNDGDNFTGTLDVRGGVISFAGARFLNSGTINVSGGGVLKIANISSTLVNGGRFALGSVGGSGSAALTISGGLVDLAQANSGNSLGAAISSQLNQSGGIFQNGVTPGGGNNGGTVTSFSIGAGSAVANDLSAVTLTGGTFISAGTVKGAGVPGPGSLDNFNFMGGTLAVAALDATYLGSSPTATASANQTNVSLAVGTLANYGGTLAPGGTNTAGLTAITGNYAVSNHAAVLAIDLGGTNQASAFQNAAGYYDAVAASGNVVLGGSLQVSLINGFTPGHGDTFTILTGSSVGGVFTNIAFGSRLTSTGGEGAFLVVTNGANVTLSLFLTNGQPPTLLDAIAQLQFQVSALPATNVAQKLKNAVLSLALEQAVNACNVNYLTDASNRVADVQGAMNADANTMAAMNLNAANIGSLVLPITTSGNPYLVTMQTGLSNALASADIPWGKTTTNAAVLTSTSGNYYVRDVGEYLEAYLFIFVNPASSCRTNAEVLTRFLRRAHTYADTIDVQDSQYGAGSFFYDDFAIAPASAALREFARLYPGLLLPSQQAIWDRAMNKAGATMWVKINGNPDRGRYANIDLLEAYQALNFGLYLTNQAYLDRSRWLIDMRTNDLYPDGAWAYIWTQNESRSYHSINVDYLSRYWLVSGYPLCTNLIQRSQWYGPVSNGRGGEFWTAPSWKQLWNSATADDGGEPAIAFSGNPYLRWMHDTYLLPDAVADTASWSSRRYDVTFYRNDIAPKTLPDNYTFLDCNIVGPSAWYGTWHYAAPGRDPNDTEPGEATLMGAAIQETNSTLWNAILMGVYPRVRESLSTNQPGTDNGRFDWAWLTSKLTNDYTLGRDFSAISATYRMHKYGSSTKGTEYNWRGKQLWLGLPDRIVGWLSVSPDTNSATAYEVDGVVRLGTGGTVNSSPKSIQALGGGVYTYGKMRVTIYDHNYGSLQPIVVPYRLTGYPATEITLQDPQSIPVGGTNLLTYTTNNEYQFVVEVRPVTATNDAVVTHQVATNGIRTLTATVNGSKYVVIQNPAAVAKSFSTNIACPYSNAAWFTGWQSQAAQIYPVPVTGGQATVTATIPAGGQIVFVNTTNIALLQTGWANGTAFFTQPAPAPVIGGIQVSGGNVIITGNNGTAGSNYLVLTTTNLALPLTNWTILATNQFGAGGGFNFTNPLNPNSPLNFYLLRLP
jgi:hypothetical protein